MYNKRCIFFLQVISFFFNMLAVSNGVDGYFDGDFGEFHRGELFRTEIRFGTRERVLGI